MGTFFTNLHVRSKPRKAVAEALADILTQPAYVSSSKGKWVSVFPLETEDQGDSIVRIGRELSQKLQTHVLAQLVHDSDIFCYWLWQNGTLLDEFDSNPHYWGQNPSANTLRGNPKTLASIAETGATAEHITRVLRMRALFADSIVEELAPLLGIDLVRSFTSYDDWGEDGLEDSAGNGIISVDVPRTPQQIQADRNSALRQALLTYDREAAKALIDAGADINSPMREGRSPLVSAAYACDVHAARFLLDVGADINARSPLNTGWDLYETDEELTPLMAVCQASREHPTEQRDMVAFLLAASADVHARSKYGRTVLEVTSPMLDWQHHQGRIGRYAPEDVLRAAAERTAEVVQMLRDAGAKE